MTADVAKLDAPPPRRTRWWTYAVRCVGLILLVIILWRVDLRRALREFSRISPAMIAAAAAMCFGVILIKSLRWHLLLRSLGLDESYGASLRVYGRAMFWGTITPGRLGEFRKIEHLRSRHDVSWGRGVLLSLLDRVFDLAAICAVYCVSALLLPSSEGVRFASPGLLIPIACVVLLLVAHRVWLGPCVKWLGRRSPRLGNWASRLTRDLSALSTLRVLVAVLLSCASLILYSAMVYVLALHLPFKLSYAQTAICVAATMLAGILPISYFNLGSREAVLIGLFALFGGTEVDAVSLAFVFVLCYVILMAASAPFCLPARREYGGESDA